MIKNRLLIYLLCLVLMTVGVSGCGSGGSSSSSSSSVKLKDGQSFTLSESVIVSSSKENDDKLLSYINMNNQDAIKMMQLRGEIKVLQQGTKINIIKAGVLTSQIETQDGKTWFVPRELLK